MAAQKLNDSTAWDMFCICCIAAKGFYLKYDEMKTDPNVQKWDVHVLTVSYATN